MCLRKTFDNESVRRGVATVMSFLVLVLVLVFVLVFVLVLVMVLVLVPEERKTRRRRTAATHPPVAPPDASTSARHAAPRRCTGIPGPLIPLAVRGHEGVVAAEGRVGHGEDIWRACPSG